MMNEDKIPEANISELETADYHDGDLDLGVWQDEIPDLLVDEMGDQTNDCKEI